MIQIKDPDIRKILWIVISIVGTIAGGIFLLGGKYSFVMASCEKVVALETRYTTLDTRIAVIDTNVAWLRKNAESKGK